MIEMTPEQLCESIKAKNWEHLDTLILQQVADLTDSDYAELVRMLLAQSEDHLRRAGCVLFIMRPLPNLYTLVLHSLLGVTNLSVIPVGASALLQVRSSDSVARDLLALLDQQPTDIVQATVFELFAWIGVTYYSLCTPRGADIVFASRLRPLWRDRVRPDVRYMYVDDIALRITTHILYALERTHPGSVLHLHELDDYPEPIGDRIAEAIGHLGQS